MSRRKIARKISAYPKVDGFSASGKRKPSINELLVEELEAMRLKDLQELSQQEAADKMGISRQTFQNIIESGRRKVTEALCNGYNIKIVGGNHIIYSCEMTCANCGHNYKVEALKDKSHCPKCKSKEVSCCDPEESCQKWC